MPTYRVSVTCKINIDYLVNAPDDEAARAADVSIDELVYRAADDGLAVTTGVSVDVMNDSGEWTETEAVEVDAMPDDRVRLVVTEEEE